MTEPPRSLAELDLSHAYRKGRDDIAAEFYLPCHAAATRYDRAVGFFSSSVYTLAWPSLRRFVEAGGRIRLVCSPVLSAQDQEALAEGHAARIEAETEDRLRREIRSLLSHPSLSKPTRVLAALVAMEVLSIRIAFLGRDLDPRSRRIFHDKLGIFRDNAGNAVVFKGSMNETWSGLSADGNLESVDVFVSWGGTREEERVSDETAYFDSLWENEYPRVRVRQFPEVARSDLLDSADPGNWVHLVEEICSEIDLANEMSPEKRPGGRVPRPHQVEALQEWDTRGRRGIFEHATGSGKTFTALCAMGQSLERGETPIVLVPSELLMDQWLTEVEQTLPHASALRCDGRNPGWRDLLGAFSRHNERPRVVLASAQTAATADFRTRLRQGEHLFFVADEVHTLGSPERRSILSWETGPRLGLSATPRRAGDPEGTRAILDYFGGIVPPPFTLQDAIEAGALCRYYYGVHTVSLTDAEQAEWDDITTRLRQAYARAHASKLPPAEIDARTRHLLLTRARISKRAAGKIELAGEVLNTEYEPGQRWIVYCDSQPQLRQVQAALRAREIPSVAYHSGMEGDRRAALEHFEALGGVLVAIRCLDEGVDIPAVDHALILASSKNPREFIQRRGRVLRTHPGKHLAWVHDALVLPAPGEGAARDAILAGEIARAIEFGEGAMNPGAITQVRVIAHRYGVDLAAARGAGVEDESDGGDDE
jgi:superfamily II DNA or RNA helicase